MSCFGDLYARFSDVTQRRKFVCTLAVYWSYIMLGWTVSQTGVALPDLQKLVNVDLDTISWIFTLRSIGYVLGSLICGFVFDKLSRLGTMMVLALGLATCSISLPFVPSLLGMLAVRLLTGIFGGGIATGANTIVPTLWGTNGGQSFVQALYFTYTLGGIVCPFITKPFMSDVISSQTSSTNFSDDVSVDGGSHESNIWLAFLITGILLTLSSILFLAMLVKGGYDMKPNRKQPTKEKSTKKYVYIISLKKSETNVHSHDSNIPEETSNSVGDFFEKDFYETPFTNIDFHTAETDQDLKADMFPIKIEKSHPIVQRKYFVLTLLVILYFSYSGAEDSIGNFLLKFCLGYLKWTKDDAVFISSLYWISSCVGGIFGIFIVRVLRTQTVLFACLVSWNVSVFVMIAGCFFRLNFLIWGGVVLCGISMVMVTPAAISWTKEHVCEITGKIASVIKIASGTGYAISPVVIGYLMENVTYMSFNYLLLGQSIVCLVCFIFAVKLRRC